MPKKRVIKKSSKTISKTPVTSIKTSKKSKISITNIKTSKTSKQSINNFEKKLEQEIQEVEQWIIERKKFFKKLAWLVGMIAVLLIVSHIYLRVQGVGI